MKKSLFLSLAAVSVLAMNAENKVHVLDFNTHGMFAAFQDPEDPFMYQGEKPGNYDIIDKYGKTVNTDGEQMTFSTTDDEGTKTWHAVTNRCISLVDGLTYEMVAGAESNSTVINSEEVAALAVENGQIPEDHIYLGWDQDGIGPARCLWMPGWGSVEEWSDVNYATANEEDWVASRHGFQMSRQGNNASRKQTYIHVPNIQAPCKVTVWAGTPLGKYATELNVKVVSVVDGVEGEPQIISKADVVAKRFYKESVTLSDNGKIAVRIGCNNHEMYLLHVEIEELDPTGINDITIGANDDNAPLYNAFGQRVNDSYKGLVIKKGKKFIQR